MVTEPSRLSKLTARLDPANTTSHMALLKAKYSAETSKILEYQKDSHKAIASCTKALQNVTLPPEMHVVDERNSSPILRR